MFKSLHNYWSAECEVTGSNRGVAKLTIKFLMSWQISFCWLYTNLFCVCKSQIVICVDKTYIWCRILGFVGFLHHWTSGERKSVHVCNAELLSETIFIVSLKRYTLDTNLQRWTAYIRHDRYSSVIFGEDVKYIQTWMLKVYHVYFQKREEWNWQSVSKCDYMKE